jgi:hypothetical protein
MTATNDRLSRATVDVRLGLNKQGRIATTMEKDKDGNAFVVGISLTADSADALAAADPDNDGATNFQEYLDGTNPLLPDASALPLISIAPLSGSYVAPLNVTEKSLGIEKQLASLAQSVSGFRVTFVTRLLAATHRCENKLKCPRSGFLPLQDEATAACESVWFCHPFNTRDVPHTQLPSLALWSAPVVPPADDPRRGGATQARAGRSFLWERRAPVHDRIYRV